MNLCKLPVIKALLALLLCLAGSTQALEFSTEQDASASFAVRDFAALFRDELHCTDALYLDGSISSLYAPELGRNDAKNRITPIIGVLE